MTSANVFKYENRLAKTVVNRGGMSRLEALKSAHAAVEEVREPTLAEIDASLREIYAIAEALKGGGFDDEPLRQMYLCANRVVAMGGVFGLDELGAAGYSLCELVSRFQVAERYDPKLVQVYVDGLRLLRHPGDHDPVIRAQVLEGLRKVAVSVA